MTIITKPLSSTKDEKAKDVLIFTEFPVDPKDASAAVAATTTEDVEAEQESRLMFRRARRATIISQTCLFLTGILALTVGFIGALHIARHLRRPHYYRGSCRLPYDVIRHSTMITGDFRGTEPIVDGVLLSEKPRSSKIFQPKDLQELLELKGGSASLEERFRPDGSIEFDYELDLDFEEFESFELPELSSGRYLHDFRVNKTAIVDRAGGRCFVMPLDRDEVPKPRSILDIISNMNDGTYELDIKQIRHDTRVILPPVENSIDEFGYFIFSACTDKTIYRLEKVIGNIIVKRSAEAAGDYDGTAAGDYQFAEFTGKSMVKYNIVNLGDI